MKHNILMFLFFIATGIVLWAGAALAADLNLTGPLTGVYYNVGKINVQGGCSVASGASAICAATQGISISPGFRAVPGSTFRVAADTGADSDGDGLANFLETYRYYTDPNDRDTDNDGMPDGWEVTYGLNPKVNDAGLDSDNDGLSNYTEYGLSTNPQNSNDPPNGCAYEYDALGRIKKIIQK